jgi:hypothetical protein
MWMDDNVPKNYTQTFGRYGWMIPKIYIYLGSMDGWCTRMQYCIAMWMDDNLDENIHNFGGGIDG